MKKYYIIIGFVVIAFVASSCYLYRLKDRKEENTFTPVLRPIPTVEVKRSNKAEIRIFPGRVRANRRVKLAFTVSGLITELNALEGQHVRKGEVLARLDQRDFQHSLNVGKAEYAEARQSFKRIEKLLKKNIVSVSGYEKAKAEHDVALAELHMREKTLEDAVLLAPFDGVVADRYVENHEHVKAKETVILFQDISETEVVIQVPERIIMCGGAENLKKIQVCFDAEKKHVFDASLRESCTCSDSITGTFDAVVVLKKRPEMKILPGMTATVQVETSASVGSGKLSRDRIMLPVEAVFSESDGKSYVWIIKPKGGTVQKQQVGLGSLRNGGIEIMSGVNVGDNVAVSGIHSLREGIEARPMNKGKGGLDG